jgi:hypothetical protein
MPLSLQASESIDKLVRVDSELGGILIRPHQMRPHLLIHCRTRRFERWHRQLRFFGFHYGISAHLNSHISIIRLLQINLFLQRPSPVGDDGDGRGGGFVDDRVNQEALAIAIELRVTSSIHLAHTTLAELAGNLVVCYLRMSHLKGSFHTPSLEQYDPYKSVEIRG